MIQSFKINNEEDLLLGAQIAESVILAHGIVVIPTDTCYGFAVDPTNTNALTRLFEIKNRDKRKAVSLIFKSIVHIGEWAILTSREQKILEQYLPGQFTFLLEPNKNYPIYSIQTAKLGARLPANAFTSALSSLLKIPYTATSANVPNQPEVYDPNELQSIFSDTARYSLGNSMNVNAGPMQNLIPDLIIDAGILHKTTVSTVVDLTTNEPVIVRQGSGVFGDVK